MKPTSSLIIALCAGLLAGCAASVPPTEFVNARQAYQHATAGQSALLVPAELHKAQEALAIAEKSFLDEPQSFCTRDLAYVADRKAKMAEALATIAAGNATTAKANKDYQAAQTEIVNCPQRSDSQESLHPVQADPFRPLMTLYRMTMMASTRRMWMKPPIV
jgi:hypothetical protein